MPVRVVCFPSEPIACSETCAPITAIRCRAPITAVHQSLLCFDFAGNLLARRKTKIHFFWKEPPQSQPTLNSCTCRLMATPWRSMFFFSLDPRKQRPLWCNESAICTDRVSTWLMLKIVNHGKKKQTARTTKMRMRKI